MTYLYYAQNPEIAFVSPLEAGVQPTVQGLIGAIADAIGHACSCGEGCGGQVIPPPSSSQAYVGAMGCVSGFDMTAYSPIANTEWDGVLSSNALDRGVDDFAGLGAWPVERARPVKF